MHIKMIRRQANSTNATPNKCNSAARNVLRNRSCERNVPRARVRVKQLPRIRAHPEGIFFFKIPGMSQAPSAISESIDWKILSKIFKTVEGNAQDNGCWSDTQYLKLGNNVGI